MIQVKIVNVSGQEEPCYETPFAAGMDLKAFVEKPIFVEPMERVLVPTGLFIELPTGYEAQVRPRSGLAWKSGITVLNSPGTIDADYRGEIKVILINLSDQAFEIKNGDRIAQMVVATHERVAWEIVEHLNSSIRGEGGFGHTGK